MLQSVITENHEIGIEHNGEVVALLTTQKPKRKIPPIQIGAEKAREGWSQLIESVSVRGARFMFTHKKNGHVVYLVREEQYANPFSQQWIENLNDWKDQNNYPVSVGETVDVEADAIKHLNESVELISKKLSCLFALVNRGGDLNNVPDLGLVRSRTAADLERYEAE